MSQMKKVVLRLLCRINRNTTKHQKNMKKKNRREKWSGFRAINFEWNKANKNMNMT